MRILIKGGVWKNTEDEILKAAVMKYGLNQWARISSLLVRKSAKQCKARWYEWLDPAIKKTEWTREEDEKLLHLAKLMPTQWRTIAPIVGRTAAQCLERYEKLLDMAAGKEGGYDPRDDPRRLRPGEIDPNPESKPARPDPVDMDEDEKEMLSEARARLANTRGKKAKRKAREKQLEEARRLATLQKKRELKAAGIEVRDKVRRRGIDYSSEVAFERRPAPGFYETGEEGVRTKEINEEFRPVTIEELEGKKRKDIEAELIKKDIQRQKVSERSNAPAAIARAMEMNEAQAVRRRGKLMLPAPQVSDAELEAIARGGEAMDVDLAEGGSEATRQLLGDYATPARFATPMRTALRTPAVGGDRLMQEAQNLIRLQQGQTPLLGGENPDLFPSDFTGVAPRGAVAATPNPLAAAVGATPAFGGTGKAIAGVSATPLLGGASVRREGMLPPGATPTPMRDVLGLNDPGMLSAVNSKREEMARLSLMRNELRAGLGQLPAPQNEYQIVVPQLPQEEEDQAEGLIEEDAADREARRKAKLQAAREAELRRRSQAMQRGLPRPLALDMLPQPKPDGELAKLSAKDLAQELIAREMLTILRHDEAKYPHGKDCQPVAGAPDLEKFEEGEIAAATAVLKKEIDAVRQAMGQESTASEEYTTTWEQVSKDVLYLPSLGRFAPSSAASKADVAAALQAQFDGIRKEMEKEAKRAAKLETKAKTVTGGLIHRHEVLTKEVIESQEALTKALIEYECFKALYDQEQRAGPERIEALQALYVEQTKKEAALQERYAAAMADRATVVQ